MEVKKALPQVDPYEQTEPIKIQDYEKVDHPSHYTWLKNFCGIEVIDITRHLCFNIGNAVKYLLRCGHKPEQGYTQTQKDVEDLRKAIFYIEDEISRINGFHEPSKKELRLQINELTNTCRHLKDQIAQLETSNKMSSPHDVTIINSEIKKLFEEITGDEKKIIIHQHGDSRGVITDFLITKSDDSEKRLSLVAEW